MLIVQEVQESMIGNRAEYKSVDTGLLANSITMDKIKDGQYKVYPQKQYYLDTKTTTIDTAMYMEYGTPKITERRHFRNTKKRVEKDVIDNLNKAVKMVIRKKTI